MEDVKERLSRIEDDVEEIRGAMEEARPKRRKRHMMMRRVLPPEVSQHLRASGRELLLAVRSGLDRVIDRMEESEPEAPSRRIPVE